MLAISAAAWILLVFDAGEAALATEHCSPELLGTSPTPSLDPMTAMKITSGGMRSGSARSRCSHVAIVRLPPNFGHAIQKARTVKLKRPARRMPGTMPAR